jgi:Leucine-rich repeat (LRR) protein
MCNSRHAETSIFLSASAAGGPGLLQLMACRYYIGASCQNFLLDLQIMSSLTNISLRGHKILKLQPLAALTNLRTIDISGNHAEYLDAICSLTNLQSLNASGNKISVLPENLTKLAHIRVLDLSCNALKQPLSEVMDILRSCLQLSTLDLSKNMIQQLEPPLEHRAFIIRCDGAMYLDFNR